MMEFYVKVFNGKIGLQKYRIETEKATDTEIAIKRFTEEAEKILDRFLKLEFTEEQYYERLDYARKHTYCGNSIHSSGSVIMELKFCFTPFEYVETDKTENIKINKANIYKIASACKKANGRATTRTLDYGNIYVIAADIVHHLRQNLGLTKKECAGITVLYSPNEKMARAYTFNAMGTKARFLFNNNGEIILEKVWRDDIKKYSNYKYEYGFTEIAKLRIIQHFEVQ